MKVTWNVADPLPVLVPTVNDIPSYSYVSSSDSSDSNSTEDASSDSRSDSAHSSSDPSDSSSDFFSSLPDCQISSTIASTSV